MASNYTTTTTTTSNLPPLPNYTLTERPSLIPGVSDVLLQMISPVVAYWVVSLFFHIIDTFDLCSQYRLHTPAEILKRNHVSRFEVLRDVIIQQILQFAFGVAIAWFDPPEMIGREEYDVAVWAQRIRIAQTYLPSALATIGLNAPKLANNLYDTYPTMASALIGGQYGTTGFATWETKLATAIYHFGIPAIQFIAAILFVDTWQYFIHRAMHMNKFLYTWLHSRHHKLYVPYAYGALYNHPLEGLFLDTLGTGIGYLITGMTVRQGLVFFTSSTIKTVDDHCGYAFPWDPLQHITSNNAAYHDIHHQSWGIKTNFSQPFLTIWDRLLDTTWKGGDVSSRYERVRIAAQRKYDADIDLNKAAKQAHESQKLVLETDGAQILEDEKREENDVRRRENIKRTPRRRTTSFDPRSTLAAVPSLHGTASPILHADVH